VVPGCAGPGTVHEHHIGGIRPTACLQPRGSHPRRRLGLPGERLCKAAGDACCVAH
jgi:hypothetical protein